MQARTQSEVLTLAEAAELYKVSDRTMWTLAKDGLVPCFRAGKQYRFLRSKLLAAAAGELTEPKPAG